jgi:polysaccharide export outer membrane protein
MGEVAKPSALTMHNGRLTLNEALGERFPLQPRDVVYIDSVPLATWSRVASLILPATQALYYSDQVYMNHR